MKEPCRRARPTWLALIALAITALLGGGFLAPATAAAREGRGDADRSATQDTVTGVSAKDLKGWAAAQRSADRERRAE
ncbi:hypothetical protein ACI2L5_58100, partial [Streptomyces milbemycinicus]